MNRIKRTLINATLPIERAYLRRRIGRLVLEYLDGVPLMVLPEVFNPTIFRSSDHLVRTLVPIPSTEAVRPTALDMGTGSAIGAVFAAQAGYQVVAVDINPEAVRCARINALLNRLESRIDVREGDLFAAVPGQTFDLVLFNPPFFRGVPKSERDRAWRAPDVLERFAAGLPTALKPDGMARIVFSSHGDTDGLLNALHRNDLSTAIVAQHEYSNETVTVYEARRPVRPQE